MAGSDSNEIRVKVTRNGNRKFLMMYFDNPVTGRRETRSTKKTTQREAERAAATWEAELRSGRYKPATHVTWAEFRERYQTEVLPSLEVSTRAMANTVFNHVEAHCNPKQLSKLGAEQISHLQTQLRKGECSEHTIKSYLAHLKAALKWAVSQDMLIAVPKITMPKRAKGLKVMKGRPITAEEFERMLDKIKAAFPAGEVKGTETVTTKRKPHAFGEAAMQRLRDRQKKIIEEALPGWRHLLRGLWLSGLRLGEALNLTWDDERKIRVELGGRRPMLIIRAELEKGNQDRLLPITPDFAAFLQETPKEGRRGYVFNVIGTMGRDCRDEDYVGRMIAKIGKKAGVKVNTDAKGKVKYASAHDLRRSFGARWAMKVMPAVLQQLMRHESIETTMKYYVGRNAEAVADVLWQTAAEPNCPT